MKLLSRFSVAKSLLTASIIALSSASAIAQDLPAKNVLQYDLTMAGQALGIVERELIKQGDIYIGKSQAKPNGLAKLFMKGDITESCQFKIVDNVYTPVSSATVRTGYKPYDYAATFLSSQEVKYKDGRSEKFDGVLWDQSCFAYGLTKADLTAVKSKTIYLNDGNKSRTFQLVETSNEKVEVPAGTFNTLKVRLNRLDKSDQHMLIWIDTNSGIPVKSTNAREGKPSISTELRSYK